MEPDMNKLQKATAVVGVTAAALTATHFINKFIFASATRDCREDAELRCFHWKFGDVVYVKKGEGKPMLLVHDLNTMSSHSEWNNVINELSKEHTVYALDLLGCGHSDKPGIVYTAYLYVQLITDFVTKVIGRRTDVIATGDSAPMVIMACHSNNSLFDKLVLVNPQDVNQCRKFPKKRYNLLRKFINTPIIGVSLYNMYMSRENTLDYSLDKLFHKVEEPAVDYAHTMHCNAHLGGFSSRFLFASTRCHYTGTAIESALSAIDNSIFIITGEMYENIDAIVEKYEKLNPAIEVMKIHRSKKLPQVEHPMCFLKQLKIIL